MSDKGNKEKYEMEYKKSQNKEKYRKEMLDIFCMSSRLVQDPNAKFSDLNGKIPILIVLEIMMIVLSFPMITSIIKHPVPSGYCFAFVVYSLIVLWGLYLGIYALRKKTIDKMKDDNRHFDLEPEGLCYIKPDGKDLRYWYVYQAIRVFEYSMVFIPKKRGNACVIAPVENLENVTAFLSENNIDIPVIK